LKKYTFITLFIALHLFFIALQIHKQSMFMKNSYEKQRLEQKRKQLYTRKQELEQQIAELHNLDTIKQFAQEQLNMQPIERKQIKKLLL
jgi:cell division protein FtsL